MTDSPTKSSTDDRLARLEARIAELEDERDIRDVITTYGYLSDFGGADDQVKLFTRDAAIDISMGKEFGPRAVTERWEGPRVKEFFTDPDGRWDKSWYGHVMHAHGNSLEIRITGSEAVATEYAITLDARETKLTLLGATLNRWALRKEHGRWLVSERKLRPIGHEEFAALVLGEGRSAAKRD